MDKSITEPERLINEGVDEFRMAATKTATGIIEQGLAVLKIKQGCAKKQGGSDFPEVAMRLLGLSRSLSKKYALIGEAAKKLVPVGTSLPAESVSTIYMISRMTPDEIADKIERGVITPTATRAQVLEKTILTTSRTIASAEDEVVSSIKDIVGKLSKKEQKALFAEVDAARKLEREAATKEAKTQLAAIQEERKQIDKARADRRALPPLLGRPGDAGAPTAGAARVAPTDLGKDKFTSQDVATAKEHAGQVTTAHMTIRFAMSVTRRNTGWIPRWLAITVLHQRANEPRCGIPESNEHGVVRQGFFPTLQPWVSEYLAWVVGDKRIS